jgi:hypothetical protein
MRAASMAAWKQSDGEHGATTATGASPCRPNSAMFRSACSVLVGMPVDGPARCTSTITSGSSSATASEIVSPFSATPGTGRRGDAQRAAVRGAQRGADRGDLVLACMVMTPNFLCLDSSCRMSDAGVIGYAPRNTGSRDRTPAATRPSARAGVAGDVAVVAGRHLRRLDLVAHAKSSVVSPKFQPALKA